MTTCPSGVNYMHLVDQARVQIERDYRRPATERAAARGARLVLPRPGLFRMGHDAGALAGRWPRCCRLPDAVSATPTLLRRIKAMLALAPRGLPPAGPCGGSVFPAIGRSARPGRPAAGLCPAGAGAAHQPGRHQPVDPSRHRGRAGQDEQCCGALTHHLGRDADALARARANIGVWLRRLRATASTPS